MTEKNVNHFCISNQYTENTNLPPKIEERSSTILVDDDAFFMLEYAPVDFLVTSDGNWVSNKES